MEHVVTRDGRLRVWTTLKGVSPNEVYSYWTEPDKLTQWWPQDATLKPVPGGTYTFGFPQAGHTLEGSFSEVVPGERLAFSWRWQHEPAIESLVVDLERRDDDTLLTVTQSASSDEARQEQLVGWEHFLGRLKDLLKKR